MNLKHKSRGESLERNTYYIIYISCQKRPTALGIVRPSKHGVKESTPAGEWDRPTREVSSGRWGWGQGGGKGASQHPVFVSLGMSEQRGRHVQVGQSWAVGAPLFVIFYSLLQASSILFCSEAELRLGGGASAGPGCRPRPRRPGEGGGGAPRAGWREGRARPRRRC